MKAVAIPDKLAPHRLRYTEELPRGDTPQEAYDTSPYKPGEIVAAEWRGLLRFAVIDDITIFRSHLDDFRAGWRVRLMRSDGTYNTGRTTVWPGNVQRGYHMAGLAVEIRN